MSDLTGQITNKHAIDLACRVPKNVQEKLMALAIEAGIKEAQFFDGNRVTKYSESAKLSVGDLLDLVGLYISVVRVFMETDEKQFRDTMTAVGFSGEFIDKFPLKHKSHPRPKRTGTTKNNN